MLTLERLRELLHYNPRSGVFTSLVKRGKLAPGDVAGAADSRGYVHLKIDGRQYYAHRLAWFYVYGEWPAEIDHEHGTEAGNGIANLRSTTHRGNQRNQRMHSTNTTGFRGVYRTRNGQRFSAQIEGRHIGTFDTPEEASRAYLAERQRIYTECPIPREFAQTTTKAALCLFLSPE